MKKTIEEVNLKLDLIMNHLGIEIPISSLEKPSTKTKERLRQFLQGYTDFDQKLTLKTMGDGAITTPRNITSILKRNPDLVALKNKINYEMDLARLQDRYENKNPLINKNEEN